MNYRHKSSKEVIDQLTYNDLPASFKADFEVLGVQPIFNETIDHGYFPKRDKKEVKEPPSLVVPGQQKATEVKVEPNAANVENIAGKKEDVENAPYPESLPIEDDKGSEAPVL